MVRSALAAMGAVAGTGAQLATATLPLVPRGGGEERLLENAGVEAAALANKLVILTAVRRALALADDAGTGTAIDEVRSEAQASWDELLTQTPRLMEALVRARAHEPSYDFRTRGAGDVVYGGVNGGSR